MRSTRREELDLVPLLNVVTLLIPMILLTADLRPVAVVPTDLPALCSCCGSCEDEVEPLRLQVSVGDQGFSVEGNSPYLDDGGTLIACRVPGCPEGTWDVAALADLLQRIKRDRPDTVDALVAPEGHIALDPVIAALDTVRGPTAQPLFPRVVIAGGFR